MRFVVPSLLILLAVMCSAAHNAPQSVDAALNIVVVNESDEPTSILMHLDDREIFRGIAAVVQSFPAVAFTLSATSRLGVHTFSVSLTREGSRATVNVDIRPRTNIHVILHSGAKPEIQISYGSHVDI